MAIETSAEDPRAFRLPKRPNIRRKARALIDRQGVGFHPSSPQRRPTNAFNTTTPPMVAVTRLRGKQHVCKALTNPQPLYNAPDRSRLAGREMLEMHLMAFSIACSLAIRSPIAPLSRFVSRGETPSGQLKVLELPPCWG